jgi:hypothetical protein
VPELPTRRQKLPFWRKMVGLSFSLGAIDTFESAIFAALSSDAAKFAGSFLPLCVWFDMLPGLFSIFNQPLRIYPFQFKVAVHRNFIYRAECTGRT